jgi:hypothetical protein
VGAKATWCEGYAEGRLYCGVTMCGTSLQGGEKEYYLASSCKEVFVPPTAGFSLRGFKVAGPWLALDRVVC